MGQVGCGLLLTGETAKLQNCLTFGGMGTPPDAGVEVGYCLLVQPLRNHQSQTVILHILVRPVFAI